MLHFLHTAPFPCCTFSCSNLFMLHFFSCCTFFMALFHVALLHVPMFSFCIHLLLHSSHVGAFSCCTWFMLHYFQRCNRDPRKHLRWGASQQLTKPLNTVAKLSILDVRRVLATRLLFPSCTFSMLHFFHVAPFSCCTLFMLHFFHVAPFSCCTFFMLHFFSCCTLSMLQLHFFNIEKKLKINKRQKTQPKCDLTLSTVILCHFSFDIL